MSELLYYTGVGSRETPPDILLLMEVIAYKLASAGFILRSGGAPKADSAFEKGCDDFAGKKEIYLPWKGFNKNQSPLYGVCDDATQIAKSVIGWWDRLKPAHRTLMSRNVYQVLGKDLKTPSSFLVCWTPDGCRNMKERSRNTGGTGQAIAIADLYNVPVYNLKLPADRYFFECMVNDFI